MKPFDIEAGMGSISPPKHDIGKNVAYIVPELYNIPDEPTGTIKGAKDALVDLALKRSTDGLKNMLK